jgi:hypothetical protein
MNCQKNELPKKMKFWYPGISAVLAGLLSGSLYSPAAAQSLSVPAWGSVQAGQDEAIAGAQHKTTKNPKQGTPAVPVQLPAGWSLASAPGGKFTTFAIARSADTAVAGVLPFADTRKIVAALAAQAPAGASVTRVWPVNAVPDGSFQGGAMMTMPDGNVAAKIILAAPLANGTSALVAIVTTDLKNDEAIAEKNRALIAVLSQLRSGRTFAVSHSATTSSVLPKKTAASQSRKGLATASAVASSAQILSSQIETVAFYIRPTVMVGGGLALNPNPVVLFKNGDALYDISILKQTASEIIAHRQKKPDEWTKWRRAGGKIQLLEKKGWDRLPFENTMSALPRGFKLAGTYRYLNSAGMSGGAFKSSILAWDDLVFALDGSFRGGGGANTMSQMDGPDLYTSTVIPARNPASEGRYEIDGYTLTLRYANGRIERRMVVADAKEMSAIYLDGDGYVRQKADRRK